MATRKLVWRIDATQQGTRLDVFLAVQVPQAMPGTFSRSEVRRLIETGLVRCNGRRERMASRKLKVGMQIEALVEPTDAASPQSRNDGAPSPWTPARILFEDEWLIAVDKPAGLPTQPTLDARRPSTFSVLLAHLQQRDGGTPYLGLHHRLDRDTSGVLLFTKDKKANAGTAALFAGKTIQKTYQALTVVGAAVPDTWDVVNHLGAVGRVQKAVRYGAVRSGGDPAQTSFRVLERLPAALLVEARPHTGRTHQIRVHLSEGGHAIFGDPFYGGPTHLPADPGSGVGPVTRVMLHAASLEFPHPMTHAALKITSAPPADFEQCRQALRSGPPRP
jgi:RluA family pseudouridine synthase